MKKNIPIHDKENRFFLKRAILVLIALLVGINLSCQSPVEPTNVTIGVPTTVRIVDQGNNLVRGAGVDWIILAPGDTTQHGSGTSMTETQGNNGVFTATIPLAITNDTSHVVFHIRAPQPPQYCYKPLDQYDTVIGYCGNKIFTYHIDTCASTLTVCDSTSIGSAINVLATLPAKVSDTGCTNTFTNNLGKDLIITPVSNPPLPAGNSSISIWFSRNGGALQLYSPTLTIKQGESIKFCFIFRADSTSTQSGDAKYRITFSGVDPQNDTCLRNVISLDAKVQVQTPCDCPSGKFTYPTTVFACVNQTIFDTIDLSGIHNSNTKCNLEFAYSPQSNKPDQEVDFYSSPIPGTLLAGNSLTSLIIKFTPATNTTYNRVYDFTITRIASDGTRTICDSILSIVFKGTSDVPSCAIDLSSAILNQSTDTLRQKLDLQIDPQGYACLKIINTSKSCDLTIGINDFDPLPSPFHFINLPLTIPHSDTGCVTIAFFPTDNDVWPNGRGNCTVPISAITMFSAQVKLNNSCPITFPIFGVLEPPPENKGLLVKFQQPKGQGLTLGVSKGTVQSSTDISDSLPIWVESITGPVAGAYTAKLSHGNAANNIQYISYFRPPPAPPVIGSNNIGDISPKNISDYYQSYSGYCGCTPSDSTITVSQYDVIILNYKNKFSNGSTCAVMYIYYIGPPQGQTKGELEVDWEICFPL